jgi:capsule polysaccharide export protein KpsE/RkpR
MDLALLRERTNELSLSEELQNARTRFSALQRDLEEERAKTQVCSENPQSRLRIALISH